jgi:drug/metabolite transporter (DMT)-like permease
MSATHIAWTIAAGVVGGAGIALLYRALAIGKMGVVSPITAVLAAALPVLIGVVRGDPLQWFQLAGVGIALVAVVLIARSKESPGMREFSTAGVKEAIASGILLGILFLALGTSGPGSGLEALLFARIGSLGLLVVASFVTGASLRPTRETVGPVVWSGAIDMTANIFFVIAAQSGALAVSAVLASLYPGSTVLLARFVLRERLAIAQKAGVALALAGVVLIAA